MLTGCNSWLVEAPEDFFTPDDFPATEADLKIALGGIDNWYSGGSNQAYFIRGWPMITEVPSDQTVASDQSGSKYEQDSYTLNPSNEWVWRVWRQIYGAINQTNGLISHIPDMTEVSQDVKDRYLGAFKFHRALNLFNAVRVWGSVPLILTPTTEFGTATEVRRAPIADIYAALVVDLQDAARLLPLRWPDSATPDDGRPTRGAANAMLADVYLNMSGALVGENHWADAAAAAQAVISSGQYSLVPNFADLWLIKNKNGPEHIFSIQFEGVKRNLFTSQSRPSGIGDEAGTNYWYSTPAFMNSFDSLDARKRPTFLTQVTVGTTTYRYQTTYFINAKGKPDSAIGFGDKRPRFPDPMPYYGKFYDADGSIKDNNGRTDLNWPIYRYADVLLMFAEAENEATGPTQLALNAINAVRTRAQLPSLSVGISQDSLRNAVRRERSWELAFESKRLFDLKRWGEFYNVLKDDLVSKIGIKDFMVFLPIPQREIDLDPALGQNPGY
jgi:hypothetical protein